MTTSTKRPDGGELKPCPFCGCERIDVYSEDGDDLAANKHVYVAQCWDCCARVSPVIGKSKAIAAWNTRTPTNESPAPQATKKTYIKPLRTIVEIDARYADQIRDLLNVPAPQPPVEGLREALELARNRIEYYGQISARSHFDHDLKEIFPKINAALASPSLTAGQTLVPVQVPDQNSASGYRIAWLPPAPTTLIEQSGKK